MWIPEPLYRSLPALYAASSVGLLMVFGFRGPAAFSAMLLLAAAVMVQEQRARRRDELRRRTRRGLSQKLLPPR